MKKALKVTFGTMLAIGIVSSTHAQDMWEYSSIAATGTWMKSSDNGLSMGDVVLSPPVVGGFGAHRNVFLNMKNKWDWAVAYSYHVPCSDVRLFLTYDHLNDHQDNTTNGPIENLAVPPLATNTGYGRVKHKADEFRIGFSFSHSVPRAQMSVDAFFEYDNVKRHLHETIQQVGLDEATRDTNNKVDGWGPGLGISVRGVPSMDYSCWGLFAGIKTALIYTDNHYSQIAFQDVGSLLYEYETEKNHSIVSKIDIRFGIDYYSVLNCDVAKLMFDAALGMRYMNMINVFKNGNSAFDEHSVIAGFEATTGFPNDWGRVGPFLQFRIGGANA